MKLFPGPNSTGKFGFRVNKDDHIFVEDVGYEIDEITDEMQSYINAGFLSVVKGGEEFSAAEASPKKAEAEPKKKPKKGNKGDAKPEQEMPTPDVTSSGTELDINDVLGA